MKQFLIDDKSIQWDGKPCRVRTLPDNRDQLILEKDDYEFEISQEEFRAHFKAGNIELVAKHSYQDDDQPHQILNLLPNQADLGQYAMGVKVDCVKAILKLDPGATVAEWLAAGNAVFKKAWHKHPERMRQCFGDATQKCYRTFKRWVDTYTSFRQNPISLMPRHKKKGNRQRKFADSVDCLPYIEAAIDRVKRSALKWSIQAICEAVEDAIRADNETLPASQRVQPPSYDVVYREINALTEYERVLFEEGPAAPRIRFRRTLKRNRDRIALDVVEIDHTAVDLITVDDEGDVVGRPIITSVICRNTKALLGYYLGYEPASFRTVSMALKMAMSPKDAPSGPMKNEWPMWGVPRVLVVDNGLEFHSQHLEAMCASLGITVKYCPRKTGWLKGSVERWFRTANQRLFHRLPGTTKSNPRERGDYRSDKKACLTIEELREIFECWVRDQYLQDYHRTIGCSPARLWEQRMAVDQIRRDVPENLDVFVGETATKRLTREGVSGPPELGLQYASNELSKLYEEVGNCDVTFRYNGLDLGRIYVVHPTTNELIPAECTYGDYAVGLSIYLHKRIKKRLKKRRIAETPENLSEARRTLHGLVESAEKRLNKKRRARIKEQLKAQSGSGKKAAQDHLTVVASEDTIPFYGNDLPAADDPMSQIPEHKEGVTP